MEPINVLVAVPVDDEYLKQIANISPMIKLTEVSGLFRGEQKGDIAAKKKLDALLAEAEVIFGWRYSRDVLNSAPRLKWLQLTSAGVDRFLDDRMLKSPVMLTTASGIAAVAIAEFVLMLMLMFVKQAPLCFQLKQQKRWERFVPTVLRSKTVGIVGLGHIGQEVARLSKAFGMRVIATRRSVKKVGRGRYVDIMLPQDDQLPRLLEESDFVVLALPLTTETKKSFGERELKMMKPTAYMINIARGEIVDEEALIRALDEKWIAGAGLDVVAQEPLPTDSRLWELPNVIISPHSAFGVDDYMARASELFIENLKRYLSGKKLINLVNKRRGY